MDARIGVNPRGVHGQPVIIGTRIPVSPILNLLAHGYDAERVLQEHPTLMADDVRAAEEWAAAQPAWRRGRTSRAPRREDDTPPL